MEGTRMPVEAAKQMFREIAGVAELLRDIHKRYGLEGSIVATVSGDYVNARANGTGCEITKYSMEEAYKFVETTNLDDIVKIIVPDREVDIQ